MRWYVIWWCEACKLELKSHSSTQSCNYSYSNFKSLIICSELQVMDNNQRQIFGLLYGKVVLKWIRAFWLALSWSGLWHMDHFHGNSHKLCIFCFWKASKFKTSMTQVPYNNLLTNLASSSHTGEYCPSVIFCTDLTALGLYCHNLGPLSPCMTLMLG